MFSELNIGRITEYFTENSINENIIGKRELKMHYNNRLKKFSDGKCLTANTICLYTLSDMCVCVYFRSITHGTTRTFSACEYNYY